MMTAQKQDRVIYEFIYELNRTPGNSVIYAGHSTDRTGIMLTLFALGEVGSGKRYVTFPIPWADAWNIWSVIART